MLVPNKTISLNESCLYRATQLLSKMKDNMTVNELYLSEKKSFNDMSDFIDVLDLLYVLGKISFNKEGTVIKNA